MKQKKINLSEFPEHSKDSPLSVHALTVSYNNRPVIWDLEYDAPSASLVAIVGPNGAGKTTFIKACLDLLPKTSGAVEFWGSPYRKVLKRVAYVPQRESVDWDFPVSALDVVLMGQYGKIGWFSRIKEEHRELARKCLEQVGMLEYQGRQINQLSGGQQQRVFLARALAQGADLYMMDEPFSGVDAQTEKTIIKILKQLRNEGKTVFVVHHDLTSVPEYFDDVIMMNMRIVASGKVSEVFNEENLRKTFGGRLTLLDRVSNVIERTAKGEL